LAVGLRARASEIVNLMFESLDTPVEIRENIGTDLDNKVVEIIESIDG
jgi:hypothetical protein